MKNIEENLHNAICENNNTIKEAENQLKQMSSLRQEIGLREGVGIAFMEQVSPSSKQREKAEKELAMFDTNTPKTDKKSQDKQDKRTKMSRTMKNKLSI